MVVRTKASCGMASCSRTEVDVSLAGARGGGRAASASSFFLTVGLNRAAGGTWGRAFTSSASFSRSAVSAAAATPSKSSRDTASSSARAFGRPRTVWNVPRSHDDHKRPLRVGDEDDRVRASQRARSAAPATGRGTSARTRTRSRLNQPVSWK